MRNEINVNEIRNAIEGNAAVNVQKYSRPKQYVKKAYCDATEATIRRKLLMEFKGRLNRMSIELNADIADNAVTLPDITNRAYARLDDMFAEVNKIFDVLIAEEYENVKAGQ